LVPALRCAPFRRAPLFALDRIWVHPQRALASMAPIAAHGARHASDHLPLVGTLSRPADEFD
jgi:endonuclease/exonuclease/phosphatase family metal-dependent hydrolase